MRRNNAARKRRASIDGVGDSPKNALNTAVKLLSIRQHSVKELGAKLATKGFSAEEIEKTVAYLLDTGYLDDAKYAVALAAVRAIHKHWGPAKIRAELSTKGVAPEIIKTAVSGQFADMGVSEGDAAGITRYGGITLFARAAFEKWLKKKALSAPLDKKNFLRAVRFLVGRGFSTASAMEAASGRTPSPDSELDGE